MLDKLIRQVKSQTAIKKVCIFFLVFAATLAIMGGNHDFFNGVVGQTPYETVGTVPEDTYVSAPAIIAQTERELTGGVTLAAVKTAKVEESALSDMDSGDSVVVKSKPMDEENADDEANADDGDKSASIITAESVKYEKTKNASDAEESGFLYSEEIPMSLELQKHTYQRCKERGLEYELILAIIWRESHFNADAVHVNTNGTRDNGIMQINDINREWLRKDYGITDLMDPFQNIDAGTAMLGRFTSKYGEHNALLAYQYGESGMAKRLEQGIITSKAVEKAYKQREYYRKII